MEQRPPEARRGEVVTTAAADPRNPRFRSKVVANFWPCADEARAKYERFIGEPYAHCFDDESHCWDFFYVPNVYCYLRTNPAKVLGADLINDFLACLSAFCVSQLDGATPTFPWLSLHLNGMRHEIHNDSCNGVYAYSYSLTKDATAFTGGETCVARQGVFDALEPRRFSAWQSYFEVIPPLYNQLTLFDDRLAHMVPVVQGSMDPLRGRVCLTGHIV